MATTVHSPNRKPRDPAKRWRAKANATAIEVKKERVVQGVAVGLTRDEAAIAAGMSPGGLATLLTGQPEFKEEVEESEEQYRKVAAGVIDKHLEESAEAFVKLGKSAISEAVRAHVLEAELRGRRVLVDKHEAKQEGPIEYVVRVVYDKPS